MRTMISLTLLGALLGSIPAASSAAEQTRVAVHDLDLTGPTGQSLLDTRIRQAIVSACGVASDLDLAGRNQVRRCRAKAWQDVAPQRLRVVAAAAYPVREGLQAAANNASLTPSR